VPNKKLTIPLVFILTIIFYIYTLSPSLAWGDGVRLQSEVISGESFILSEMAGNEFSPDPFPFSKVGITAWDHPLYIVMGHSLVKALPAVDSIWLVNLISAIFGAAAVALVFLFCYQYTSWYLLKKQGEVGCFGRATPAQNTPHPELLKRYTSSFMASIYAALSLAVSHTFWWHSSTPEAYTLLAFLLLASLYFFDRFERTGRVSALTASAFFLGLAGTVHLLAFLAIPALVIYFLLFRNPRRIQIPDWRKFILPLLGFIIGFLLYIIQFIRMTRSFSISEIMGPVVGSTFLNGLGAFSPISIAESLFTYLLFLSVQFGPLWMILGVFGIRKVFEHPDTSLRKILSFYIVYTIFGIFYRVTDQFAFFLMSHVFFALLMGVGAAHFLATLRTKSRFILTSVLILSILVAPPFYRTVPRLAKANGIGDSVLNIPQIGTGLRDGLAYYIDPNKRGDYNTYDFGNETIMKLAPNSVVIAEWYTDTDEYFVLRYFTKVRKVRSDVTILGWPTQDPFAFDPQLVLKVIEDSIPQRPTYLASLSDRFYAASKLIETYCIVPENNLYRLHQKETNGLQCLEKDSVTE
jgi:hypothetical protein